ncbi:MAG: bifunctional DNA primase/polymerase [Candidatus Latescibacteria bacterium]|nr:bifunctional DNA primase/polymerase [Candidatus Latescibacterota bacterium]
MTMTTAQPQPSQEGEQVRLLLAELAGQGICLELDGENLRPRGGKLPPGMRQRLVERKAEILAYLHHQPSSRNGQTLPRRRFLRPAPGADASPAEWAAYYVCNGFSVVHVKRGKKGPDYTGWQKNPIKDERRAVQHWTRHPADSIGVVLGASGLCSLDVDDIDRARPALGAVGIALDALLDDPAIPRIEGNPQKARLLFLAPTGEMLPPRKLTLTGKNGQPVMIFELRAGLVQDLLPPSWHPSGKPYRWLRAPWDIEEIPEPPATLLNLWRRWEELQPRMLAAIDPDAGQRQAEQAACEYRAHQGQGETGWDEVRRQIRERRPLAEQLARMDAQERGRGKYSCILHPPDLNPSFWLHGDLWICAHGGAPVGFTSSKTGYSVGDVVDLYQFSKGLDSPGKATVELARELGIALPDSSERAGRSLPPAHSLTDPPRDGKLPVEQSAAPLGGPPADYSIPPADCCIPACLLHPYPMAD